MTGRLKRGPRLWLLVAIVLLAFGLRLYRLGTQSLWYDEAVSVYLAGKSLPALVAHTAGDIHPPGYYLLLHVWTGVAGSSDFSVAFPSLFFGMILVALAYWTAKCVFGERAGLLVALLVAVSPYNIWYSQEVRMYTLGAALGLGVLGSVLWLCVGATTRKHQELGRLAIYVGCAALGLWALYYFGFLLVAVNLLIGLWWLVAARRRLGWAWLARWLLAQGAVLLLYAPWLPIAWRQATEPPVPPWRSFTGLGQVLVEAWSALCLGQSADPARVWPVLLLLAALFVLGLLSRRLAPVLQGEFAGTRSWPLLLGGSVFLPVVLIYLSSFITPLFHVRYAFTYSTPFYLVVGAGLAWLWQRWRPVGWLSLAVVVAFSGISLTAYHTDPRYASDDHRAATGFLAERWRPGDAILVNAGYAYTALLTYWDGDDPSWRGRLVHENGRDWAEAALQGPVLLQTGTVDGAPGLGWGNADSDFYAMSWADTSVSLDKLFATFDRVWVYRIYDTVTDPDGQIRTWLDQHGTLFEDRLFDGEAFLRVQGFLTGRDPLAGMEQIPDQNSGEGLVDGSLQLAGHTTLPAEIAVGSSLDLALAWRVATPPGEGDSAASREWILFAGLFDDAGRRWAQTDEHASGPHYPVMAWPEGATVRTPLRIVVPPGIPPGAYEVEVGWYRFEDGQPVWLPWPAGDRLKLGRVKVVAPEDWWTLVQPAATYTVGVTIGGDVRLLGFDAPLLEAYPGQDVELELLWQALVDGPDAGLVVLQLQDDAGRSLSERASVPADGRVPFAQSKAGQTIRDPQELSLPGEITPGIYNLAVGRRRPDGTWLSIQRRPFGLGSTYPLATLHVLGRSGKLTAPTVQFPVNASFGEGIQLVGYDMEVGTGWLPLTLYWRALAPMEGRYKMFLHLVGAGGRPDTRGQADLYPHLPTTAWQPGEYLHDEIVLDLPADLPAGQYSLLLGWYDEASGERLPVFDGDGAPLGDSLELEQLNLGE